MSRNTVESSARRLLKIRKPIPPATMTTLPSRYQYFMSRVNASDSGWCDEAPESLRNRFRAGLNTVSGSTLMTSPLLPWCVASVCQWVSVKFEC